MSPQGAERMTARRIVLAILPLAVSLGIVLELAALVALLLIARAT